MIAYFSRLKPISALLLGVAFLATGVGLLTLALPLRMEELGWSLRSISTVQAGYFVGLLLGAIYGRPLMQAVGHIRAFATYATLLSVVVIIHPLMENLYVWGVLRVLSGFLLSGLYIAIEAWINARSESRDRAKVMALYFVLLNFAFVIGQLLINLYPVGRAEVYILSSLAISLSLVPVAVTRYPSPEVSHADRMPLTEIFRASPLAFTGALMSGGLTSIYFGLFAYYARVDGMTVSQISLFSPAFLMGGTLLILPIGYLADRFDRRTILLVVMAVGLVATGLFWIVSPVRWVFWLALGMAGIIGMVIWAVYPIAIAQAYDALESDSYLGASSALMMVYSFGSIATPRLVGEAMTRFGNNWFMGALFVLMAVMLLMTLYRMFARAAVPVKEQEPVLMVQHRTAMEILELDPRLDEENTLTEENRQ